jgi:hypothetical protein
MLGYTAVKGWPGHRELLEEGANRMFDVVKGYKVPKKGRTVPISIVGLILAS